ncbi:NUDIX hydrolase [Streptomyces sp. NPDC091265]|uniref:NUDIX hydrolase n=1 Tax=unclassified Streptomyces TaxID=2593676 RepID=UPI00344C6E56
MPITRSHIRATLDSYLTRHPHERESLAGLFAILDGPDDPSNRATLPGHVTGSAVVIDRHRRVLHIVHKATGLLLTPGGHAEADRSLLATALREVSEETGIQPGDLCLTPQFLGAPVDIDVHGIDANPATGEPSHQHFDFRFAFYVSTEQLPPLRLQDEEVSGAQWLAFADVRSPTLRAKLLEAQAEGLDGQPEPVNASVLVHDGFGRYLLHLRDLREGIWAPGVFDILGGGRERGDRCLEGTLRRELAEEAPGLEPVDLRPYAVAEATSVEGLTVPIALYTARWSGHPDTADLQEGILLQWFTPDMLDRLPLSPGLGELIRRHAAEHPPAGSPPDRIRPLHQVTGYSPRRASRSWWSAASAPSLTPTSSATASPADSAELSGGRKAAGYVSRWRGTRGREASWTRARGVARVVGASSMCMLRAKRRKSAGWWGRRVVRAVR